MLTYLRKNMKAIMIAIAVIFAFSMFYGLGYTGVKQLSQGKTTGFLKVNGKEVDPVRFNNIFSNLRQNFSDQIKPSDMLFIQNLALSQTIDFCIVLDEARKRQRVSGNELDLTLEQIAKQQRFSTVSELKNAVIRSNFPWDKFKKMIRDDIIVNKMNSEIRNSVKVSPNDLREIRASHILIRIKNIQNGDEQAKKISEDLLKRARAREDFAKLAKQYSEDPGSKNNGGDLGFFSSGMMVRAFEELAFSLKVGDIGGPIKTDYGYHIIKVVDARLKKIPGKSDIEAAILQEKQEKTFQEWFYNLKQKSKVEILDPALRALDLRFKGKISDAILEYNKAIEQDPSNAYIRLFLGLLYEDVKQGNKAVLQYKEAVRLAPGDPSIYLVLGKAYLKMNNRPLALEQFKKASLIAGDNKKIHKELERSFKEIKMADLAANEKKEIMRIEKKEVFEKSLNGPDSKVKTE